VDNLVRRGSALGLNAVLVVITVVVGGSRRVHMGELSLNGVVVLVVFANTGANTDISG
jgi:hypothetical protein